MVYNSPHGPLHPRPPTTHAQRSPPGGAPAPAGQGTASSDRRTGGDRRLGAAASPRPALFVNARGRPAVLGAIVLKTLNAHAAFSLQFGF